MAAADDRTLITTTRDLRLGLQLKDLRLDLDLYKITCDHLCIGQGTDIEFGLVPGAA